MPIVDCGFRIGKEKMIGERREWTMRHAYALWLFDLLWGLTLTLALTLFK